MLRRAAIAVLIGLAAGEIGLRIAIGSDGLLFGHPLPPYGALTQPGQRAWLAAERRAVDAEARSPSAHGTGFDAELGWVVSPDTRSDDGRVSTNSIGARGAREYPREKAAGSLRIACFGDSFTWCDEVEDSATWPAQLEALDPRVEAINLGVAAYGTDQALLRFRRQGRALRADVVCVGLLLENVGRNVNRYRPLWYPGSGSAAAKPRFRLRIGELVLVPHGFATHRELVEAIEDGSIRERLAEDEYWHEVPDLGVLSHVAIARVFGAIVADRAREVERLWRDPEGEPYVTTIALLQAFVREAHAAGARHGLVLVLPRKPDLEGFVDGGNRFWSGPVDDLRARSVDAYDLAFPLADEARARGVGHLFSGGHLSRAGNAIVARTVHEALVARGLAAAR